MELKPFKDLPSEWQKALEAALEARKQAYAPYSKFTVGACLITEEGSMFTGANVENASYGLSICAERSAAVTAVSEGQRSFSLVAVTASHATVSVDSPVSPCGACRQFLMEFRSKQDGLTVLMAGAELDIIQVGTIDELLPGAFSL